VVPGLSLVAALVVAGESGQEFLSVAVLDIGEELLGLGAAEHGCPTSAVDHHDLACCVDGPLELFRRSHSSSIGPKREKRPLRLSESASWLSTSGGLQDQLEP